MVAAVGAGAAAVVVRLVPNDGTGAAAADTVVGATAAAGVAAKETAPKLKPVLVVDDAGAAPNAGAVLVGGAPNVKLIFLTKGTLYFTQIRFLANTKSSASKRTMRIRGFQV